MSLHRQELKNNILSSKGCVDTGLGLMASSGPANTGEFCAYDVWHQASSSPSLSHRCFCQNEGRAAHSWGIKLDNPGLHPRYSNCLALRSRYSLRSVSLGMGAESDQKQRVAREWIMLKKYLCRITSGACSQTWALSCPKSLLIHLCFDETLLLRASGFLCKECRHSCMNLLRG